MTKTAITYTKRSAAWAVLLFSTFLVCQFLFFIDEGYYDLRWMKDPGNWLVFLIYTISIFALQLCFYEVLLINYRRRGKVLLSFTGGLLSGLALLVWVLSGT